ncbi:MLO-LIKE PROTEIN 1 [Salix viminalis]|uniref:MLO-LIKE PROTEIN 1 n=1 Tax=Salix viminalis TaxID=40686 RepID=A0A9Q0UJL0_SALVM|nr:MLO-LIKE PROTEIN 1 [Salix viminalis]
MAGGEAPGARDLEQTPTWAVSAVCAAMIIVSIILDKVLHRTGQGQEENVGSGGEPHRRLLWSQRRILAGESKSKECKDGSVPLISVEGLHQLHIFIFFLAVFHVVYSAITMMLGKLKIRNWKDWERESWNDHDAMNDPARFRLTHETSFVRGHTSFWTKTPILFYSSTTMGLCNSQSALERSWMEGSVLCFLSSFILSLSYDSLDFSNEPFAYLPVQNAFELTYFLWAWYEFGKESCVNQDTVLIIVRVTFGVGAQVLCSYATLPLYALVTQMGSTMKRSIFDQQTSKALKSWHQKAVKKTNEVKPDQLPTRTLGGSPDASSVHSPSPTRSPPDKFGIGSPRFSDVEAEAASRDQHTANITATVDVELNHLHRPGDNSSPFVQRDLLS